MRKVVICLLAALLALAGTAPARAEGRAYQGNAYFDQGYSVYAFAEESRADIFAVDVYLQFTTGYNPADPILAYDLYVNGALAATLPGEAGETIPMVFTASVGIEGTVESLVVVPVLTQAGALRAEQVDLMPPLAEGSHVGQYGVVNNPNPTDRLNLRIAPSGSAESMRQYYNGVRVLVLGEQPGQWLAVRIGDLGGSARGYMKADYLAFGDEAAAVASMMPEHEAQVASWTLYSLASEGSAPVAEYGASQPFRIMARSSSWWHILVDDVAGFVRADVITQAEVEADAAQGAQPQAQPEAGTVVTATDAGGLRHYAAERRVEGAYTVQAALAETGAGVFDVDINVQFVPGYAASDSITSFVLYVGSMRLAEVPLDWEMRTAQGLAMGYRLESATIGEPSTVRLVPRWEKAGEDATQAIGFVTP